MTIIKHIKAQVLSMYWYSVLLLMLSSTLAIAQETITVVNENPLGKSSTSLVQGTILRTSGVVTFVSSNGLNISANPNMKIPIGSILKTGLNSWLTVHWMEGADSVITENAKVSVLALDYSNDAGMVNRRVVVRLYSGKIYNKIANRPGSMEVRVKTSLGDYFSHDCRARLTVCDDEINESYPTLATELAVQEGEVQAMDISGSILSVPRQNQASISSSAQPVTLNPANTQTSGNNIRLQSFNNLSGANSDITNILKLLDLPTIVAPDGVYFRDAGKVSNNRSVSSGKLPIRYTATVNLMAPTASYVTGMQ